MKTEPIVPAHIEFGSAAGEPPHAPDFGDLYHPRVGAAAQARHVFLNGNGLPARWASRPVFTVLETGFGLGNNFLATWDGWRRDPARCERLFFVSIERHPPRRDDLARAQESSPWPDLAAQLLQAWPPLVPNLHPIEFDGGRVQLLLALGDASRCLPALRLAADAFYLDGFAPARNPAMWQASLLKTLGRKAAPGATAATWSVAREVHDGLTAAGFELRHAPGIGGKREITVAQHAPRFEPRVPASAALTGNVIGNVTGNVIGNADASADAIVVGAGLAGAAAARALARLGVKVTVIDRRTEPAGETSGNAAGLFHGTVNGADGRYARLFRAAALVAQRDYSEAIEGGVSGCAAGLLRLAASTGGMVTLQAMRATLGRLGLPADYVQALEPAAASQLAGVPLAGPAWFYPGGGWIAPPQWVRHALSTPGIRFLGGVPVAAIERQGHLWLLRDAAGRTVAQASIVVLAQAAGVARLLARLADLPGGPIGLNGLNGPNGPNWPNWPIEHSRGQVTRFTANAPLRLPVAGDGYALPLPGGDLLCGATHVAGEADGDDTPRAEDHRYNLQRLWRLTGLPGPAELASCQGRVGWRLHAGDRLPIAGAVPRLAADMPPGQRLDQARLLPRQAGLFVLTALGARGLTLAPLLGRLVAAQATGTPWPMEQDLADAVDPARWIVRAARVGMPTAAATCEAAAAAEP